jgi:hypothetical protein
LSARPSAAHARADATPNDHATIVGDDNIEDMLIDTGDAEASSIASTPRSTSSVWTIPALCIGLAIIASCILIPAADENRRLAYDREGLKADLAQLQKQASVNDAFLGKLHEDPSLAERLAQRQMKMVREGTQVLKLENEGPARSLISPYLLVTIPPPAERMPYVPVGGKLAEFVRPEKNQLYLIGAGLLLVAMGLVFGANAKPGRENQN